MSDTKRILIVTAMEREVAPLVRGWRRSRIPAQKSRVQAFQNDDVTVVCSGMGAMRARIASEAAYQHAKGEVGLYISAGFGGALQSSLKVGDIVQPREV